MGEREYPQINGYRLRELRISRGLMLRRLERASAVPCERLNELEPGGGAVKEDTIEELADALGAELSELLAD